MKTFLFLDDWMLDSYRDVMRRFPRPEQVPVEPLTEMNNYWGTVTMRCVKPRSGDIAINFRAPAGKVLVQLSEPGGSFREPLPGLERKPIPGFSFEDCIPLTGDVLYARPRWKNNPDPAGLIGKHVRLEFKLFQAELYAVRWDVQPWYGDLPIERI